MSRARNFRDNVYQDSYYQQPYEHTRRDRFSQSSRDNSSWPRDWHSNTHHTRFEMERKRERTRRLKQLQSEAERRVLTQLAEDRRLLEEQFRMREFELRQQEEASLFHDEQQALYEEEEEQQRRYAERLYADDRRQPRHSHFAYEPIPSPHNSRYNFHASETFRAKQEAHAQQRYQGLQHKVEAARQSFNQHYPDRQFDEELAEEEEVRGSQMPSEFPIILSLGKIRRELIFVPGMTEQDLLENISNAFPDLPITYINGLRPLGEAWVAPLDVLCNQPEFLLKHSRLAISLAATPQAQTSYEENTEEDEQEQREDEGEEGEHENALEGEEADEEDENEVLFDEREFFMTQEESDAVEALIEARDPAVQLAYGAYPQLSKLVNGFVRIIRMLAVPQDGEEQEEEEEGQPQDDAFDSLLSKTISWMAKQNLIDDRQEKELCALAAAHDPGLLEEIRQTASLEDLIQNLRAIANQYEDEADEAEGEQSETGSSQIPRVDAEVLHNVFEQLTNEEVSEEVMSAAMDLITNNDPDVMRAIWAYSDHRDWAHLLQTLEILVETRKRDENPPKPEMHSELRDQIFAMRARILGQRQALEEKRATHQHQRTKQSNGTDGEAEQLEKEWSRVSKQLEELDELLQGQLTELDRAAQGLDVEVDMEGLKSLVAVLNMDPSIGVTEASWVKKFVEEMDPGFLNAYFEFQRHQSYDQYKERLLELIREAEESKQGEEEEGDYIEGDEEEVPEDFGQKVLQLLYKGQLIKGKDRTVLTRLLNEQDDTIMSAFQELHATNNWTQLYETLLQRVSQVTLSSDENAADAEEEDLEGEGDDEGDAAVDE